MSLAVLFVFLAALLVLAPDVFLVIFAGLLLGVFFGGGGDWLATRTGIGRGWGVGLFVLLIVLLLSGAVLGFAPMATEQFDRLVEELPSAVDRLTARVKEYPWGEEILRRSQPSALISRENTTTAVTTTFGALGNFVIMLFIGLYVALDPETYRKGVVAMLAPSVREAGDDVLRKATNTLKKWLVAKLMAMAVVGVLTWLGLWIVGVPLAAILGLIAALLAFIPNIGPILAAAPAIMMALTEGPTMVLLVVAVYLVVQTIESYLITPLIQQEQVSLPPVLVISMQLLMGALFGLIGLALATPLAALGMTLIRETYIRRYLEKETETSAAPTRTIEATDPGGNGMP
ncbi:AI-2E family transporter [Rhodopseudomonas sp. NSM]|uniref:AI-2E family transporter n=1 Tax=Rhodopseudomonas sp. NSM TaxID=3457630 RepID=UPI004035AAA0